MRLFSIPYNGDINLLDRLFETFPNSLNQIRDIYFAPPKEIISSGRFLKKHSSFSEIETLLSKCEQFHVQANLVLNPSCIVEVDKYNEIIRKIDDYIESIQDKIQRITLADYRIAMHINKRFPQLQLECSVNAYINTNSKVQHWVDIGCEVIVVHPDFNKNINYIKNLKNFFPELELKLIVNEDCLPGCPLRTAHNNAQAHGVDTKDFYNTCQQIYLKKPWLFYKSPFIPPKCLCFYDEFISTYKLVDRSMPTDSILKVVGVYLDDPRYNMKVEMFNNRIPLGHFKNILECDKNCFECDICKKIYYKDRKSRDAIEHWLND